MEPIIKSLDQIYCDSLTHYSRRKTVPVQIGDVIIGGDNHIVVQSMTTVDTMDTIGSVEQSIRMIESGSELIRITAQVSKRPKISKKLSTSFEIEDIKLRWLQIFILPQMLQK
jgi:(E)-4-hydroxy-3-methylbut-2-enyl-diphosphate synthase